LNAKLISVFIVLLALLSLPVLGQQSATDWNTQGISLLKLGKYNESLQAFNKSLEIKTDYGPAWANKGAALLVLGKYNESLQAYNKAITINSNDAVAWNGKGKVFYLTGKYEDALTAFNKP
jgi:superkiller protein 3